MSVSVFQLLQYSTTITRTNDNNNNNKNKWQQQQQQQQQHYIWSFVTALIKKSNSQLTKEHSKKIFGIKHQYQEIVRLLLYAASFQGLVPPFLPFICIHNNTWEQKTGYCECKWKVKTGEVWKWDYTCITLVSIILIYHSELGMGNDQALGRSGNEATLYMYHSLVPRLPHSGMRTLKLCRRGEPGIFCHMKSAIDRPDTFSRSRRAWEWGYTCITLVYIILIYHSELGMGNH